MADILGDEGFEGAETGVGAGVCFADDGDDGGYSGETGEDVDVQCIETVWEGVVVMRGRGIDHVECTMDMRVEMFLRPLHFCLLQKALVSGGWKR